MKFIVVPKEEKSPEKSWPKTLCVLCPEDPREC